MLFSPQILAGSSRRSSGGGVPFTTKTIDGTAGGQFSATNTGTITLTTTLPNDVIVLLYLHESNTNPAATISTVTSPSLTWAKRSGYAFNVNPIDMEIWWAPAAAALTAEVVTITLTGTIDDSAYHIFGVNGSPTPSSPWDVDASLATAHNNGANPSVTVSGVNTNSGSPMLIGFTGTPTGSTVTKPTVTTSIRADQNNGGGVQFAHLSSFFQNPGSQLSGANYTTTSSATIWGMIVDALA
jgi:hypothetical protein